MFLRKLSNTALTLAILAASAAGMNDCPAFAQQRLQDSQGRQTVAPSQMPQSPMLKDDLTNKPNGTAADSGATVAAPWQTKGKAIDNGGIVFPPGIPADVRIGSVEPVSLWGRLALGAVLFLQLAACVFFALALQMAKIKGDNAYQGGKIINEGHTDGYRRGEQPLENL